VRDSASASISATMARTSSLLLVWAPVSAIAAAPLAPKAAPASRLRLTVRLMRDISFFYRWTLLRSRPSHPPVLCSSWNEADTTSPTGRLAFPFMPANEP